MNISFNKKGNKIHIKKSNEGKFTDYCGGKVTDKCILKAKSSGNSKLRKRAIFAENARKWKHAKGGSINGSSTNPEGLKQLPKENKDIPSASKLEQIKRLLKKYPGLTESQAAGKAPIKIKGKTYYVNNLGNIVPVKKVGGKLIRKAAGGEALASIAGKIAGGKSIDKGSMIASGFNAVKNMVNGAIDAGKGLNTKNEALLLKSLAELDQLEMLESLDKLKGLEAIMNQHKDDLNPEIEKYQAIINDPNKTLNEKVAAQAALKLLNQTSNTQMAGIMSLDALNSMNKNIEGMKLLSLKLLGESLKSLELANKYKQSAILETLKIGLQVSQYNAAYTDAYNKELANYNLFMDSGKISFNVSDYMNTLTQLSPEILSKIKTSKKGGKVFGNYEDPTDDCGKVNPRTKKLIKRKGYKNV